MYSSFFSKFNIDIDVSRTWNWSASPSDEMERKYFYLSRLFAVERVFFVIFEVTISLSSSYVSFATFLLSLHLFYRYHPSHSCTSHHYVVGTLSHIKWVSSEYATSLKIVHQCWLVGCNLWLNDKKGMFLAWNMEPPVKNGDFASCFLDLFEEKISQLILVHNVLRPFVPDHILIKTVWLRDCQLFFFFFPSLPS